MMSAMRPGRGENTTTRSARNTASAMLWVTNTTVLRVCQPDALQLDVHLVARQRIERAERLVHQQQRRARRSARGRSRRAGACRRRARAGSGPRTRKARSARAAAPACANGSPAPASPCEIDRQHDVVDRCCATRAAHRAGTPCRRWSGRTGHRPAVHAQIALGDGSPGRPCSAGSVLLPQPLGPSTLTNSPGRMTSDTSSSAVTRACARVVLAHARGLRSAAAAHCRDSPR